MTVENYWIDRKLKSGRDYPDELSELITVFNAKVGVNTRTERREIDLIERLFNDYAVSQSNIKVRYASLRPGLNRSQGVKVASQAREVDREEFQPWGRKIQRVINKVNKKLALLHPQILRHPLKFSFSYYLEPTALLYSKRYFERDKAGATGYWVWFAKVIDGTDPRIFRQCPHCKLVFFSRQRKKFHTECRPKYFSEKYRKEGRNAERQRRYRLRKKRKVKSRKHT